MKNTLFLLGFIAILTGGCQMHSSGPDFAPGLSHMDFTFNTSSMSIKGDVYDESTIDAAQPTVESGVEVGTSDRVDFEVNYGILVDHHLEIGATFEYATETLSTDFSSTSDLNGDIYRIKGTGDPSKEDVASSILIGSYARYYFGHQGPMHHWVQGDVGYNAFDFFSSLDLEDFKVFDTSGLYVGVSAGVTYFLTESTALEISAGTTSVFGKDTMTDVAVQGGIAVFN